MQLAVTAKLAKKPDNSGPLQVMTSFWNDAARYVLSTLLGDQQFGVGQMLTTYRAPIS